MGPAAVAGIPGTVDRAVRLQPGHLDADGWCAVDARRRSARRGAGAVGADRHDAAGDAVGVAVGRPRRSRRPTPSSHCDPGGDGRGGGTAGVADRCRTDHPDGAAVAAVPDRVRAGADRAGVAGHPAGSRFAATDPGCCGTGQHEHERRAGDRSRDRRCAGVAVRADGGVRAQRGVVRGHRDRARALAETGDRAEVPGGGRAGSAERRRSLHPPLSHRAAHPATHRVVHRAGERAVGSAAGDRRPSTGTVVVGLRPAARGARGRRGTRCAAAVPAADALRPERVAHRRGRGLRRIDRGARAGAQLRGGARRTWCSAALRGCCACRPSTRRCS